MNTIEVASQDTPALECHKANEQRNATSNSHINPLFSHTNSNESGRTTREGTTAKPLNQISNNAYDTCDTFPHW